MRTLTLLTTAMLCFALGTFAAEPSVSAPQATAAHSIQENADAQSHDALDPGVREMLRQQQLAANKKRQAELKQDTDKLLQLATELKQYVDKTNENVLSVEVINKAAEIEKLSKSVQKKMLNQ